MHNTGLRLLAALLATTAGCGSPLPDDLPAYESECVRMNGTPIPRYDGDPHPGIKNVYACNVDAAVLQTNSRPFPEGTLIVKDATRESESFPWLIAIARKRDGAWRWDEYTRNFADEGFRHGLAGESVCTGCHVRASTVDWIFTPYTR
jgi:hypothetical protein